jgi:hypothetical protein
VTTNPGEEHSRTARAFNPFFSLNQPNANQGAENVEENVIRDPATHGIVWVPFPSSCQPKVVIRKWFLRTHQGRQNFLDPLIGFSFDLDNLASHALNVTWRFLGVQLLVKSGLFQKPFRAENQLPTPFSDDAWSAGRYLVFSTRRLAFSEQYLGWDGTIASCLYGLDPFSDLEL